MRTTINDLKVKQTFYKRNTDALGNVSRSPYEEEVKRTLNLVTGWTRFGHYIIDVIIISAVLFVVNILLLEILDINFFRPQSKGLMYNLIPTIDRIVVTVAYYFLCEHYMQRTIGKFATNSVVINEYAESPSSNFLIGRSFARLVPFEALSCLGDRGWHDKWSKTYVVKTEERDTLKKLLNEQQGVFVSDSADLLD